MATKTLVIANRVRVKIRVRINIRISGDVYYPYFSPPYPYLRPWPRPYIYSDPDLYPFPYGCYSYPIRDYKCFSNHAYGNCGYNNLRALLFI